MRKTIRRGVLITATAACALGFGLGQASATGLPGVPELPLSNLAAPLSNLGSGVTAAPTMPTLPGLPGEQRSDLPLDTGNLADIAGLGQLTNLTNLTDLLGGASGLASTKDLAPTDLSSELPTGDLGLDLMKGLPIGLDQHALPGLPSLPTGGPTTILDAAPTVLGSSTEKLPVMAQIDNNIPETLVPNTDGVSVYGVPKPQVPNMGTATDAVKLPTPEPVTPGTTHSIGLPRELPLVSELGLGSAGSLPSGTDLLKGAALPTELPQLPTV
nr:hypothetical protein [Kibdelosporangium sp. MJ126-NF4]CEL15969.1 hypothetical protein [Kibdelosporangium sp. MJ126-NF4]CTQ93893.1 hypothetical protein [Kibdelosporangium sp. MJ126-NF4]